TLTLIAYRYCYAVLRTVCTVTAVRRPGSCWTWEGTGGEGEPNITKIANCTALLQHPSPLCRDTRCDIQLVLHFFFFSSFPPHARPLAPVKVSKRANGKPLLL